MVIIVKYEFTYQEGNTISHGIIDLLIEREDKMIIVDYKLKNIEDKDYISKVYEINSNVT